MSETQPLPEEEFVEYGDYDLAHGDEEEEAVPADEALAYPDQDSQDDEDTGQEEARAFVAGLNVRTPEAAIDVARAWSKSGHYCGVGQCLATVRQYFGISSKYGTAAASWYAANHKYRVHSGYAVPRGVPVYWTGGSHGAGHIALSVGGGMCLSTDWKRSGRIDYARIDDITRAWHLNFQGYAAEINDVVVWKPATKLGVVSLSNLHLGRKNQDVHEVKQRLHKKGYRGFSLKSYRFGFGLKRAYAKYQRHLGYTGSGANGIPGRTSLKKLGFDVI